MVAGLCMTCWISVKKNNRQFAKTIYIIVLRNIYIREMGNISFYELGNFGNKLICGNNQESCLKCTRLPQN